MDFKEPLDVDLSIGHRRTTQKDLDEISEFIRNFKQASVTTKSPLPTRMPTLKRKKVLA